MHKIEFMAWEPSTKRMIEDATYYEACRHDVNPWIYMQYTGLRDKNGKKIYEGDIVKIWNRAYEHYGNVVVEYNAPSYKLRWVPSLNCPLINIDDLDTFYDGEVIGNIRENPELLQVNDEVER